MAYRCGGVDQRRRRWGVSPASEKDGVVEGFHRFWPISLNRRAATSFRPRAGPRVSAVVGFHRRWAHCRAPDGGVTGAFCFVGDAGFQRFFAQSRRGDTDGAATMRSTTVASGASASTFPDGELALGPRARPTQFLLLVVIFVVLLLRVTLSLDASYCSSAATAAARSSTTTPEALAVLQRQRLDRRVVRRGRTISSMRPSASRSRLAVSAAAGD